MVNKFYGSDPLTTFTYFLMLPALQLKWVTQQAMLWRTTARNIKNYYNYHSEEIKYYLQYQK